ncbi:MAG TPA: hypothetical protein VG365_03635 [Solirubrobacteraceae bacterium]|nr:hypothetical protein [Solirubrobacteraceae bacterium]
MKVGSMPNQQMPLDPLALAHLGIATLLTDLIVVQRFGEAVWRQSALMVGTLQPNVLTSWVD